MKHLYIKPYEVTGSFWRWVVLVHLCVLFLGSWRFSDRSAHYAMGSMVVQMRSGARSGSQVLAHGGDSQALEAQVLEVSPEVTPTPVEPPAKEAKSQAAQPSNASVRKSSAQHLKKSGPAQAQKPSKKSGASGAQKGAAQNAQKGGVGREIAQALSAFSSGGQEVDAELGALFASDRRVDAGVTRIRDHIAAFWVLPILPPPGSFVTFHIRLDRFGKLVEVKKKASSGHALLDQSALEAIQASSPFPMPEDRETASLFLDWELTLRPEELR